jgi:ABC-type nitrate/sulfonate/bicarbonate transport system substrate-binding protein
MERFTRRVFFSRTAAAAVAAASATRLAWAQARPAKIRTAYIYSPGSMWAFNETLWPEFARELGVEIEGTQVSNVTAIRSAFARGEFDLIVLDPIESLNLQLSGGGKPRIIATALPKNENVIIVNGERIRSIRDLGEKRLAISTPGATAVIIMQVAFARQGVDLASSGAHIVGVGGSALRAQALLSGRVDGTILNRDDAHEVMAAGARYKVLIDCAEAVPLVYHSLHGRESFLDDPDNRESIVRSLVARGRMLKWVFDNKWKYLERYVRRFPTTNIQVLAPVHDAYVRNGQLDPDMTLDFRNYAATMNLYAKEANPPLAKGTLPVQEWVDRSFLDPAIRRLGGRGWWRS